MYGRWSKDDRGYHLTDCCGQRADQYGGVAAALGGPGQLDGGYCPAETYKTGNEGDRRLTYAAGCTVLSVLDRSIDHRGGNHSTFILPGEPEYRQALSTARSAFPHVFRRLGLHPVRLREVRL